MAHPRKEIRHAIVQVLTSATAAGARVEHSRVEPYRRTECPAISVYTPDEESELSAKAPRELEREPRVLIAGWVVGANPAAAVDAMDDLAEQIEAAMNADVYLGGKAAESILESTDLQFREEDGRSDPQIGIVTLVYRITYRTSPAPPSALDEFRTVGATHKPAGSAEADAPRDLFNVQQP